MYWEGPGTTPKLPCPEGSVLPGLCSGHRGYDTPKSCQPGLLARLPRSRGTATHFPPLAPRLRCTDRDCFLPIILKLTPGFKF